MSFDDRPHPDPSRPGATGPAAPLGGGVVRDPIDLRDRIYEPSLRRLPAIRLPDRKLMAQLRRGHGPWLLPREQGEEGTCAGQALAALIDIERLRIRGPDRASASARMIYECARLRAGDDGPGEEGIPLRDALKAFYHYGACTDRTWPYRPRCRGEGLTYKAASEARHISLGAYYRLPPRLNAYHAALNEAGAVLVSAALHDGWREVRDGRIRPPALGDDGAGHAFVIVGYTPEGFVVLNSWGRGWGGWQPPPAGTPVPGLALWSYADWADRIIDGWVLRLGAGPADAFDFSIGDMGMGMDLAAAAPAPRPTPLHAILGNVLHLDDGDFVTAGGLVTSRRTLDETMALLAREDLEGRDPAEGLLLTFAGALQTLPEAVEQVARWKRVVRARNWHPLTVLWCTGAVAQARAMLETIGREALARTGPGGRGLDRAIEAGARPFGRALWRDLHRTAAVARPRRARCGSWWRGWPGSRRRGRNSGCVSWRNRKGRSRWPRSCAGWRSIRRCGRPSSPGWRAWTWWRRPSPPRSSPGWPGRWTGAGARRGRRPGCGSTCPPRRTRRG